MAVTKVTTKVLADDAVTIDKIADAALVTETEGISSNDNDTTIPTSAAVKDYVDTQDGTKEDTITGAATTITGSNLTASKALVSNASGKVAASTVTDTELGYLSGVSGNVQDQFDALTDNDTTYTIAAADGDNADEEKIVLTGSDSTTDTIVLEAGTGLSISRTGDKITFTNTVTDTDTVLTAEQVEDIVGAMVASNSESGISVTYDDTNGKLDFSVTSQTDENFTTTLKTKLDGIAAGAEVNQNAFSTIAVSGQTSVNADSNTDTLTFAAGSGIQLTTDAGTDTVTITSTATGSVTEAFKTISVAGQNDVVADGATDTLTLAAGSNITLTTDAATDTITIASTASGGGSVDVVTTQHTGDGSTQGFALDSTPGDNDAVQVYLNGVYQVKDAANYSISGSTLTFVTPPTNSTAIEFVHFKITAGGGGGISWDTTVKTSAFTAIAGEGYFVNTTSAAITVTLPSSPSAGDEVSIVDYAGTADTNKITITSSDNINGASDDVLIDYERGGVSMVYVDATQGWIAYNATNETASALNTIPLTVDYLVVAGGGAGGSHVGGGGGAGGLRTSYGSTSGGGASAESSLSLLTSTNYTVSVGPGGAAGAVNNNGGIGSDSVFSAITSDGGGGGGSVVSPGTADGLDGGSGGGASGTATSSTPTAYGGSGTVDQGYAGGNVGARSASNTSGAGGGGAASAGATRSDASSSTASLGNGGDGIQTSITGTSYYFSGGGGAGAFNAVDGGAGGLGGGGGGASTASTGGTGDSSSINAASSGDSGGSKIGGNGANNSGGGGGGGGGSDPGGIGGSGGSGIVILRYPDYYTISETTSGGNVLTFSTDDTTVSGTKITTFTAGANGTIQFS